MLSNNDILNAIERGDITINPFDNSQLGANSYDVRLGNTFFEVHWDKRGPYFVGPLVYLDGEKVEIPVGGTLLGVTKEIIGTSGKIVAELRSRSTTRRLGITTNCDAGLGDIGYCDYWTMEFTAFATGSPYLVTGDRIAQMVFYECKSEPVQAYSGQYVSNWPLNMIPKAYRDRIYQFNKIGS